jgi:predicted methyltransferase
MSAGFLSVLSQAQRFVSERTRAGDIAVDATAGGGVDTLFLSRLAGVDGKVFAFDVQDAALDHTRLRLEAAIAAGESLAETTLLLAGHERMAELVPTELHGRIAAVMFNLGYLPGADKALITQPATTLVALEAALLLLRGGGVLSIVVYPGHEGGDTEAATVEAWASGVPPAVGQCVLYRFPQRLNSPYLIALVKR